MLFRSRFHLTERHSISLQVQAFNVLNHANYYVHNGNGVNATQYLPFGDICGNPDKQPGLIMFASGENGPYRVGSISLMLRFSITYVSNLSLANQFPQILVLPAFG